MIGEAVLTALTDEYPKVCHTLMQQKLKNWTIPMLLPKRKVDQLIGRRLGLVNQPGLTG